MVNDPARPPSADASDQSSTATARTRTRLTRSISAPAGKRGERAHGGRDGEQETQLRVLDAEGGPQGYRARADDAAVGALESENGRQAAESPSGPEGARPGRHPGRHPTIVPVAPHDRVSEPLAVQDVRLLKILRDQGVGAARTWIRGGYGRRRARLRGRGTASTWR